METQKLNQSSMFTLSNFETVGPNLDEDRSNSLSVSCDISFCTCWQYLCVCLWKNDNLLLKQQSQF